MVGGGGALPHAQGELRHILWPGRVSKGAHAFVAKGARRGGGPDGATHQMRPDAVRQGGSGRGALTTPAEGGSGTGDAPDRPHGAPHPRRPGPGGTAAESPATSGCADGATPRDSNGLDSKVIDHLQLSQRLTYVLVAGLVWNVRQSSGFTRLHSLFITALTKILNILHSKFENATQKQSCVPRKIGKLLYWEILKCLGEIWRTRQKFWRGSKTKGF
jgi:hypothetical protein